MALTKVKAGNIILTTPGASSNDVTPATTQYVTTALANLADSAPSTLNTLNELAAALGDDANYSTTTTAAIAAKLPLAGGELSGTLNITQASTADSIKLTRSATSNNSIIKFRSAGADKWIVGQRNDSTEHFRFYSYGTSSDVLSILTDGKIGIGTSTPTRPLVLYAASSAQTQIQFQNSTTGAAAGDGFGIGLDASEKGFIWNYEGNDTYIGGAGGTSITIKNDGKVGIGRDPTQLLEVHKAAGGDQTVAKFSAHNYGDTGKTFIELGTENGDGSSRIGSFNDTGNKSTLVFQIHSASSGAFIETMRLASNGYIHMAGASDLRLTLGSQGTAGNNDANWIRGNGNALNFNSAAGDYVWEVGGSPKMRLTSAGTLGLKTTPKTWSIDGLQLGTNAALSEDANSIYLSANAYMNSGWKRTNNQLAGYLRMGTNDGIMSFSNAVNGSADSAITWVERFRVHTDGNVGIGTAAPINSTNKTTLGIQGAWGGEVNIMVGTVSHAQFGTDNYASGQHARIQSGSGIVFKSGGSTERMRIDSSGNTQFGAPILTHIGGNKVFINKAVNAAAVTSGTTQTGGALRLRGGDNAVLDMGLNSINAWIQATDRANLANTYELSLNPNGGNVGIGRADPAYPLHVYGANYSVKIESSTGYANLGSNNTSYFHFAGDRTFYFGNRCEASGGFHTYSDERLKENIVAIPTALDKVAQMNGVTFNWKDASKRGGNDTGKQFGVTAQNMAIIDSELPSLGVDPLAVAGNEETDEKYYTMDYTRITPFLIEAVKELKTKLEAAEARIATLEG